VYHIGGKDVVPVKAKVPNWLWVLLLVDLAAVALMIGSKFGGWVLPGWVELLASLAPTLTFMAWGLWEYKPGGVWDQYEARTKDKKQ